MGVTPLARVHTPNCSPARRWISLYHPSCISLPLPKVTAAAPPSTCPPQFSILNGLSRTLCPDGAEGGVIHIGHAYHSHLPGISPLHAPSSPSPLRFSSRVVIKRPSGRSFGVIRRGGQHTRQIRSSCRPSLIGQQQGRPSHSCPPSLSKLAMAPSHPDPPRVGVRIIGSIWGGSLSGPLSFPPD